MHDGLLSMNYGLLSVNDGLLLSEFWASLGYSGLLFWATWLSVPLVRVIVFDWPKALNSEPEPMSPET